MQGLGCGEGLADAMGRAAVVRVGTETIYGKEEFVSISYRCSSSHAGCSTSSVVCSEAASGGVSRQSRLLDIICWSVSGMRNGSMENIVSQLTLSRSSWDVVLIQEGPVADSSQPGEVKEAHGWFIA